MRSAIERPIVVGLSFAGFVAQRYLARHPDHPSKVILRVTTTRLDLDAIEEAFSALGDPRAGAVARRQFDGDPSVVAEFFERCLPYYSVERLDPASMATIGLPDPEMAAHWAEGEHRTMDLGPGLREARCPVLVLAGRADPVMPTRLVDELVGHLPPDLVAYESLPSSSHFDVRAADLQLVGAFIRS